MIGGMNKGSFTIEATVYVPIILFAMMEVLSTGIYYFQECKNREENHAIAELDIIREFYNYQILEEIGKEVTDD